LSRTARGDRAARERNYSPAYKEHGMASGNDMKAHAATYEGFLALAKWGSIAVALVAAFVIYMITR
jgi:hypothetical protein